jgi:hypothetical protein
MIEANEVYDLAMRYNVSGILLINIYDDSGVVLGAVPVEYTLEEINPAIGS